MSARFTLASITSAVLDVMPCDLDHGRMHPLDQATLLTASGPSGLPVTGFAAFRPHSTRPCGQGSVAHEDVEPGFCTVGLLADPLKMRVRTYDVAGKPAKRPFHLAAFRD